MADTISVQPQNPAETAEKKSPIPVPYTDDERKYADYLQSRLQLARDDRNRHHDEFDGMTYAQFYESNLKGANSFIAPKKNREDTTFVTGTTRQALLAMVAELNQLNLAPEVKCFDENDNQDVHTGQAMEDILYKAGELDHDEEKQLLRQYEMFSQGTVFVEETWTEEFIKNKELNQKKWAGEVKGVDWTERLEKVFEGCRRNIIPGPNMYLGSFSESYMELQPFVYTVDYIPYDEAKAQYGEWERWQYVQRDLSHFAPPTPSGIYFNNWRLSTNLKDHVEVVKYQDKWKNEFMIVLNGVMMMPIGFPLPWKFREYNIAKQIYELISPFCAYGGSLVKRLKTSQALEDEFWRLAILKTQKSFMPARANLSGSLLSGRVFMPGKITPGIDPATVKKFDEDNEGVTSNEVQVMQMLKDNMHDNSTSALSQGQQSPTQQSATEILQLQQEAKKMFGLAVFSGALLEKKLAILRAYTLLENWFEPIGTEADTVRQSLNNKYRSVSRQTSIPGAGRGRRVVKLAEKLPRPEGPFPAKDPIYDEEEQLSKNEGQPVRITYLNPKAEELFKYTWHFTVNPREKESSDLSKAMFNTMITGLQQMGQTAQLAPFVNLDFVEERFAEVWNLPVDKAFNKQTAAVMGGNQMPGAGGAPGMPPPQPQNQPQQPGQIGPQIQAGVQQQNQTPSLNTMLNGKK